ncbi:hypothetical protein IWW36_001836 [Coemansia brasiliensis]|uniref:Uncharacterized protein n=1 Tax=Coemansia brasiliensis TaxID=2650707 RepID=A0A9W8IEN6_9FUNG|nr:hypothetical protein IWW36_001836 [Coemansia brasiliensis]
MNFPGDYNGGSGAGGFQMPGMNEEGDLTRGYNGPMDPYGGGPPGYARPPNSDNYGPPQGYGSSGPNQGPPQGYGPPGPNQRPPQGYGNPRPPHGYGPPGPDQRPPQGYNGGSPHSSPGPNNGPQGYNRPPPQQGPGGYGPRPQQQRPYGQAPNKQRPEMDDGPIGPAPSSYGSSASLPGAGRPQNPPKQRPPKNQGPPPQQSASPLGGLDMASLAPLAMGLFGGGNKGGDKGSSGGGLGALAALAPMAMGLLSSGGGGKSGSGGGGGLGPLMGIASSFLGGGGGSGGNKKSSAAGGDFFSGILAKVFGSGTRDIENGSMQGLDRKDAEHFHRVIYMEQADLRSFNDEQLGAAAAIQAIGQMHKTGSLNGGHEDASQKMLGAVMGEAVSLVERQESMGGSADKEETATAAVRTALKVIDDAANMHTQYGASEPHPMHRDNSFGSSSSNQYHYPAEQPPYSAPTGGYPQSGGYQQGYPGGFQGGYNHQSGYDQSGYNQGGYNQGYNQGGYNPGGYNPGGY